MPATWSGTPSRLAAALRTHGHDVTGIHSIPGKPSRIGAAFVHLLKGFQSEFRRNSFHRNLSASIIQSSSNYHEADLVIHTGTLDAPIRRIAAKARHVCYLDCTWSSWARGDSRATSLSCRQIEAIDRFEKESLHAFDHIFPIGKYVVDELVSHYGINPQAITPVGTGIGGVEPFSGVKHYGTKKILCIAKERHRDKGVHLLVAAFSLLKKSEPDACLTIIGGSAVANELPSIPGLTLTGRVSKEELENHLREACLFAMPATNEPWGLVFLESLAHRVPILGLPLNALPEITGAGQFGFLAKEQNPDCIASLLKSAINSPEQLEVMGAIGQKHVLSYYTWNQTAERILAKISLL